MRTYMGKQEHINKRGGSTIYFPFKAMRLFPILAGSVSPFGGGRGEDKFCSYCNNPPPSPLQRGRQSLLKIKLTGNNQELIFENNTFILLLIIFNFLFPFISFSQNTITTDQFLATALNEQSILLHDRHLEFLKNTNHELPWAEELEFRTETDEMNLNRQEYLMRYRFHSKTEIKAHRNLRRSEIELQEMEKIALLENALMDNYFLLVKYITLEREINIKKQQQLVAVDKLNVLRKKAAAIADVDLNDILVAENKNHELELELMELEGEFEHLKKIISSTINSPQNFQLDTSNFISINDIIEKSNSLPRGLSSNIDLAERKKELDKNDLELEQEIAENNWKIDFVQFKAAGRDNLNFAREWSFGLGMEIPLKGINNMIKNEFLLERMELENRYQLQEAELLERLLNIYRELDLKINLYQLASRQLAGSQLQYSFENYPQFQDTDPLVLLNINSNILRRQADRLEIEKDIYQLYLDIVEMSGKAVEMPLRNYLNKEWSLIN